MKKLLNNVAILACAASLCVATAQAVPLKLADVPKSTVGGLGDGNIQTWLLGVIGAYNAANNPDLPTSGVGAVPDDKTNVSNGGKTVTLNVSGYEYLVIHWGGQGGGTMQAWHIGSCPDGATHQFTTSGGGGISFYSYYDKDDGGTPPNRIPDGGNTLPLLAAAAAAVAGLRYRFNV